MAEFSKEYITLQGWDITPDFSIHLEFKKLKEGEMKQVICEVFGFNAVLKEDNYIVRGEVKTYNELQVKE